MYTMMAQLTCGVFLLLLHTSTKGLDIEESPSDVTVFVNSTAKFRCATKRTDYQLWRVNGISFIDLPSSIRDDIGMTQETEGANEVYILSISGMLKYDGTLVQCIAGDNEGPQAGESYETENATLRIQGTLSSVTELRVDPEVIGISNSVNISWSAPFSLDVTDVDRDIWYSVLIYNMTDEETPTAIPCTDCHNLTQTHYIFSTDHPSPCHKYNFTVIPQNGAGEGDSSRPIAGAFVEILQSLGTSKITSIMHSKGNYSLELRLPEAVVEVSCAYSVFIESDNPECSAVYDFDPKPSTAILVPVLVVPAAGCLYKVTVELQNGASRLNSTQKGLLDTRELLATTEFTSNGSLQVNCMFINVLPSSGCYIVVTETSIGFYSASYITSEGKKLFPDLQPGKYAVLLFGMENEFSLVHASSFYTVVDISTPTPSQEDCRGKSFTEGLGIGIIVGVVSSISLAIVALTAVLLAIRCYKLHAVYSKKSGKVVTEPNEAYATVHSTISAKNMHHHSSACDTECPLYDVVH